MASATRLPAGRIQREVRGTVNYIVPGSVRAIAEWFAVTIACATMATAVAQFGWLWRIDQAIYDVSISTLGREVDQDLVIVAIDEHSLEELGPWPWPRRLHAQLIRRLAEAHSGPVALDVIFSERDHTDPAGDEALEAAIEAHGQVVLPMESNSSVATAGNLHRHLAAGHAAGVGHAHVEFDSDGVVRSVYLWAGLGDEDRSLPQLSLALLALSDPALAARYERAGSAGQASGAGSGWLRIPFSGPPGAYRRVSFVDVVQRRVDPRLLEGRPIFVGAVAGGMGDLVPTPTAAITHPMPGVEVNANIYSALRSGRAVASAPRSLAALAAIVVVIVLMLAMIRLTPREALIAAFSISIAALIAPWLLLHQLQLWLPPAGALLGAMLAYPLWSWRRLEAIQRYLDEELLALQREADRWRPIAGDAGLAAERPDPIYGRLSVLRETAGRQRQMRHFMMDTLDGLPTGVVVVAPDGALPLYNRRAGALLGCAGEQGLLEALRQIRWPEELSLEGGLPAAPEAPISVEVPAADKRNLHITIAALLDRRSRMHGVVLTIDDITPVKQAQERREAAMQYVSHDLRSPLSSIVTLVENFEDDPAMAAGVPREELQRVGLYARSALHLTENLFRLVRAEGVDARRFTLYDLNQLVDDASEEAWTLAQSKNVRIERAEDGEEECPVLCEPDMLKRAVLNLLTNAIKYSPACSTVRLRLQRDPRGWRLEVHDEGEGIAAEDLRLLFQRFGRLEKTTGKRVAGLGLGLMIVKTVVERHGGSVEVVSEPGLGSIFTIRLPFAHR